MTDHTAHVVTRIAPSPTGHLHIGTTRAALFNFLYARHHNGTFILRSEDTDKIRGTTEYESEIQKGLEWLGIYADAFYRQSERTYIYKSYLEKLLSDDAAYVSREASRADPDTEVEVIRLRNPNKTVVFQDEVRGEIRFDTTELEDFVIARDLEDALYHFAVVVDDHEMGVTHVIRGEDHISNTPRQMLIAEALDIPHPIYAHLPLILGPDRSKMSKRHGAVSLDTYRVEGFLPEAMVNYLALLGWNPGGDQEFYTLQDLIEAFDLKQVQKGGAIFDKEKLFWINKQHIAALSDDEFTERMAAYIPETIQTLPQYSAGRLKRLMPVVKERIRILSDIEKDMREGEYDFVFTKPEIDPTLMRWKNDEHVTDAIPRLKEVATLLTALEEESGVERIRNTIWPYAEKTGKGEVLWPLRVALTGKKYSPDPFMVIHILGIKESIDRIEYARATIERE